MLESLRGGGQETRFMFFGGKGGVGKTSISAATALRLAEEGRRTLVISTDPAHSLSDVFDTTIQGETRVAENLFALEIDPEEAMEEYQERMAMEDMPDAMQGMDMMSKAPGMDEMAAFDEFMKYMRSGEYDCIIFDTAPTGHTLNLLELPEMMDSMVGKMLKIRMQLSGAMDMVKGFFGGEDEEDETEDQGVKRLRKMKQRIEEARDLLASDRTAFNFVLIPEKMSVYETERALDAIGDYDIPVGRLYMNKVLPENEDCDFCSARRSMQQENIADAERRFGELDMVTIPLFKDEVRGMKRLRGLAGKLELDPAE
ncbi:MAG: ArsA family ATPase [Candidatus Nanohaloarchaea archaeon]|nr:ArsA family ATPase [Candidatus Nanohaloarchaea archaeon]